MEAILNDIYDRLYDRYGDLNWWPAETPYEVMVGAVLTQNTSWNNVVKAIDNFAGRLSPEYVAELDINGLCEIIRPAGFFNQKAIYLKELTHWFYGYGYSVQNVRQRDMYILRSELLSVKGVGNETADSILLYALSFPSFVVDAYTKRLLERLGINIKPTYQDIKSYFEDNLIRDAGIYNNFHALIVINAKEHCKAKPKCRGCPLDDICKNSNS